MSTVGQAPALATLALIHSAVSTAPAACWTQRGLPPHCPRRPSPARVKQQPKPTRASRVRRSAHAASLVDDPHALGLGHWNFFSRSLLSAAWRPARASRPPVCARRCALFCSEGPWPRLRLCTRCAQILPNRTPGPPDAERARGARQCLLRIRRWATVSTRAQSCCAAHAMARQTFRGRRRKKSRAPCRDSASWSGMVQRN